MYEGVISVPVRHEEGVLGYVVVETLYGDVVLVTSDYRTVKQIPILHEELTLQTLDPRDPSTLIVELEGPVIVEISPLNNDVTVNIIDHPNGETTTLSATKEEFA